MRKLSLWLKFLTFPLGLLSSLGSQAAPPPVPTNVRAVVLPAEVLLTWDGSTEADHYRVYRGGPNRRWILPAVTKQPRFRDTEFSELPSYYQIAAVSSSGEIAATAEFQVFTAAITVALVWG